MTRHFRSSPRSARRRDDGFTSLWVLGLAIIVLTLGVAIFDIWNVFSTQRTLTARADAAAAAGAQGIDLTAFNRDGTLALDATAAHDAAWKRLQADVPNVTEDTSGNCTAVPDRDPVACIVVENPTAPGEPTVTVRIKQPVTFTIFAVMGRGSQTVSASSKAAPRSN